MGWIVPGVVTPTTKVRKSYVRYRQRNAKNLKYVIERGYLPKDRTLFNLDFKTYWSPEFSDEALEINIDNRSSAERNGVNRQEDGILAEALQEDNDDDSDSEEERFYEPPQVNNIQDLPIEIIFKIIKESGELHNILKVNKFFYDLIKMNELSLKFGIIREKYLYSLEFKRGKSKVKSSFDQYDEMSMEDFEFHHENALLTRMDLERQGQRHGGYNSQHSQASNGYMSVPSSPSSSFTHTQEHRSPFMLPIVKRPYWEIIALDGNALSNTSLNIQLLDHIAPHFILSLQDIHRLKKHIDEFDKEGSAKQYRAELINTFKPLDKVSFPFVDELNLCDETNYVNSRIIKNADYKKLLLDYLFKKGLISSQAADQVLIYYLHLLDNIPNAKFFSKNSFKPLLSYIQANILNDEEQNTEEQEEEALQQDGERPVPVKLHDSRLILMALNKNIIEFCLTHIIKYYSKEELSQDVHLWGYIIESRNWNYIRVLESFSITPNASIMSQVRENQIR